MKIRRSESWIFTQRGTRKPPRIERIPKDRIFFGRRRTFCSCSQEINKIFLAIFSYLFLFELESKSTVNPVQMMMKILPAQAFDLKMYFFHKKIRKNCDKFHEFHLEKKTRVLETFSNSLWFFLFTFLEWFSGDFFQFFPNTLTFHVKTTTLEKFCESPIGQKTAAILTTSAKFLTNQYLSQYFFSSIRPPVSESEN